jgi:phosphohistidine swiveling domain-containing protein
VGQGRHHRQALHPAGAPGDGEVARGATQIERYTLGERGEVLAEGRAIGQKIGSGTARVVRSLADMDRVQPGDVLVADMTDPDWEPVMKRASAIVTNRGGRTCHAAIIARELGVPAVVGTGNALDTSPTASESRSAAPRAIPASSMPAPCPSNAPPPISATCRRRR